MSNSTELSTILLLCLGGELELNIPAFRHPSIADLRRLFGHFGALNKVIIFSKKTVLKAFLEFSDARAAQKAREALNDRMVECFGRAKIYFSALQELENNNKFLEYWDAREQKENMAPNVVQVPRQTLKDTLKDRSKQYLRERLQEFTPSRPPFRTVSDFGNASQRKDLTPETRSEMGDCLAQQMFCKPPSRVNFLFGGECQPESTFRLEQGSVVLVSNLDAEFGSARELFNLFSCFGYISKILMMKNLRKALVEFRTLEQAAAAVNGINSQNFPQLRIKANFSKYQKIDLKKNNKSENSQQFNEVIIPSAAQNRFGDDEVCSAQQVTTSVLISCPKASDNVKYLDIYVAIQEVVQPSNIKLINDDGDDEGRPLTLQFDFCDTEKAVLAITKLHGLLIKDSPLSVSFCS